MCVWFYTDELGVSFFLKLIWIMEDAHADERVVDCLVMFFLSYNRHITASDGNVIVQAIAEYGTPKIFTERLMILFNRGGQWHVLFSIGYFHL